MQPSAEVSPAPVRRFALLGPPLGRPVPLTAMNRMRALGPRRQRRPHLLKRVSAGWTVRRRQSPQAVRPAMRWRRQLTVEGQLARRPGRRSFRGSRFRQGPMAAAAWHQVRGIRGGSAVRPVQRRTWILVQRAPEWRQQGTMGKGMPAAGRPAFRRGAARCPGWRRLSRFEPFGTPKALGRCCLGERCCCVDYRWLRAQEGC